jgi:hypothetical protein
MFILSGKEIDGPVVRDKMTRAMFDQEASHFFFRCQPESQECGNIKPGIDHEKLNMLCHYGIQHLPVLRRKEVWNRVAFFEKRKHGKPENFNMICFFRSGNVFTVCRNNDDAVSA